MPLTITARNGLSSNAMPEIMRVIDEIAFRTNILALNAAVGAAEAIDAGNPNPAQGVEPEGNAGQ